MTALGFLAVAAVLLPIGVTLGAAVGWSLCRRLSVRYKQRWLEAVSTLHVQEARYSELLTAREPALLEAPKPPAGPWRLKTETYAHGTDRQRTCFLASRTGQADVALGIYMWRVSERTGDDRYRSPAQLHKEKLAEAVDVIAEMNRAEALLS